MTARRIAYFISPHGYGHAARAAAVMAALLELDAGIQFELFTLVPDWFFRDSLIGCSFGYHALLTDIGMVQRTALVEDVPETVRRLDAFLPFDPGLVRELAERVLGLGCRLVVCDIAPLGIAVARQAGLPSLLVENFTWDWIYQGYAAEDVRMAQHAAYLADWFAQADYRVQTAPARAQPAQLHTAPVSRRARTPAQQIRAQLGVPPGARLVMLTMGGVRWQYNCLDRLANFGSVYFVIPGADEALAASQKAPYPDSLLLLPHHSEYFHPDLVNASDAVVGKVGYSTVAEVYWAGIPFAYIARPKFRESQVLSAFVEQEMAGLAIPGPHFESGAWVEALPELLELPRLHRAGPNGARQVASFIHDRLV